MYVVSYATEAIYNLRRANTRPNKPILFQGEKQEIETFFLLITS